MVINSFNLLILYTDALPVCKSVHHTYAWCQEARKGLQIALGLELQTAV